MEKVNSVQSLIMFGFSILFIVFLLLGFLFSVKYQKMLMDIQGAKSGLRKSILYLILAFGSGAIIVYASEPDNWLSSLCLFAGGLCIVFLYFIIRTLQIRNAQKYIECQKKTSNVDKGKKQ